MISKAKRERALQLLDQLEASCSILKNKLGAPLSIRKLEDVDEHMTMTEALLEEAHSLVRAAIWRTNTGPAEWLGPLAASGRRPASESKRRNP